MNGTTWNNTNTTSGPGNFHEKRYARQTPELVVNQYLFVPSTKRLKQLLLSVLLWNIAHTAFLQKNVSGTRSQTCGNTTLSASHKSTTVSKECLNNCSHWRKSPYTGKNRLMTSVRFCDAKPHICARAPSVVIFHGSGCAPAHTVFQAKLSIRIRFESGKPMCMTELHFYIFSTLPVETNFVPRRGILLSLSHCAVAKMATYIYFRPWALCSRSWYFLSTFSSCFVSNIILIPLSPFVFDPMVRDLHNNVWGFKEDLRSQQHQHHICPGTTRRLHLYKDVPA